MLTIPTTVPSAFTAAGAMATCMHMPAHDICLSCLGMA